jgi:TPR repeat protein
MDTKSLNEPIKSDYELVLAVSENLADFYKRAVSQTVTECYPDALVNYRSALSVIVSLMFEALGVEESSGYSDLRGQVDTLSDFSGINFMSSNLMHNIRISGNKGSHSEEYPKVNFESLSKKTHTDFFKLLKELFPFLKPEIDFPEYEFRLEEEELNITTLSNKALFENDNESQYLVAKKLYSKAQKILLSRNQGFANKKTIIELENGEKAIRYHDIESAQNTSIAFQLFDACKYDIHEAEYEYGKLLLIDGHWISHDSADTNHLERGVNYIHGAANHGVAEASSLLGRIKLHGLYGNDIDTEWALELLGEAAEKSDSLAIFELANYHFNHRNYDISLTYFKLAAQLGSPKAQYLLAKYYLEDVFTTDDETEIDQLINDASAAGVKEALLLKARRLAMNSRGKLNQEAIVIYEQYADKQPVTAEGLFECAQYFIKFNQKTTLVMHYLISAAFIAKEESNQKLAGFISFLISNVTKSIDKDMGLIIKFPQESLMKIEEVNLSKMVTPVTLPAQNKLPHPPQNIGRNELCYCGSGRKYKKCCLN